MVSLNFKGTVEKCEAKLDYDLGEIFVPHKFTPSENISLREKTEGWRIRKSFNRTLTGTRN